jgi:hypothetical protein
VSTFDRVFFVDSNDQLIGLQKYTRIPRKLKKKLTTKQRKEMLDTMVGFPMLSVESDKLPTKTELVLKTKQL